MIEETVRVITTADGVARVRRVSAASCGSCASSKGCGVSSFARFFGSRSAAVEVVDTLGVRAGQRVVIGIEESALLRGSLLLYGLPLMMMIVLAVIASHVAGDAIYSDLASLLAGATGLAGGLMGMRYWMRFSAGWRLNRPVILRRESDPETSVLSVPDIL